MKTHKHLYPFITDFENLRRALKNAARGKRAARTWPRLNLTSPSAWTRSNQTLPLPARVLAGVLGEWIENG